MTSTTRTARISSPWSSLPGRTLDQCIGRNGLLLKDTLKYGIQIADGLARAHAAGIHADGSESPLTRELAGSVYSAVLEYMDKYPPRVWLDHRGLSVDSGEPMELAAGPGNSIGRWERRQSGSSPA
jgi:hypothetical protein